MATARWSGADEATLLMGCRSSRTQKHGFEVNEEFAGHCQVFDDKFKLGLFPAELEGVQFILWRYIENEIEGVGSSSTIFTGEKSCPSRSTRLCAAQGAQVLGAAVSISACATRQLLAQLKQRLLPFEKCWPQNRTCSKPARVSWTSIFTGCSPTSFTRPLPSARRAFSTRPLYQRMGKIKADTF